MASVNDDIFTVSDLQHEEGNITAKLNLVTGHPILEGHFPGQPVVPGACMLDLVKQVIADAFNETFQLKTAGNIKFIQMITPENADDLRIQISYKRLEGVSISVNAAILNAKTACFKLQAVFARL